MANFKGTSRYGRGIAAKTRNNKNFLVLRRPIQIKEDASDIFITVTQEFEKRPDLLSNNVYGTAEYWWVIYEFNNIRDPLFGLKAGQILRIPAIERVLAAIEQLGE